MAVFCKNTNGKMKYSILKNPQRITKNIKHMKKTILTTLFFWAMTAIAAFAQTPPAWYDHEVRKVNYPTKRFFKGYAEGMPAANESIATAMQRLKDAARVEALATIRVLVQSQTTSNVISQNLQTMGETFRQSTSELKTATTTSVDMEIPGLLIEEYRDPETGMLAAFAYVKKSTLIQQLLKQIAISLTKVEMSLDQIDQLVATGQKLEARTAAEKAMPLFAEVDDAQQLLVVVDTEATEESLMLAETRTLQLRLIAMVAQLKNALTICIQCDATIFGTAYPALRSTLQGHLSKLGCNFVTDPTQADWVVRIQTVAREYNTMAMGNVSTYFTYVDATISVLKSATNQLVYEDMLSEKGGHTHNYEQAARDAYKYLTPKICKAVEEQVKQ